MVVIPGISLALTVPLAFGGPLCPSREHLQAFADQANHQAHGVESIQIATVA